MLKKRNSTHTKQKLNSKPKKKWFGTECANMKKQVKISSKKKHKSPSPENRTQHRELLKNYKRHCRHKQVEFWKKEKIKINEAEELKFQIIHCQFYFWIRPCRSYSTGVKSGNLT